MTGCLFDISKKELLLLKKGISSWCYLDRRHACYTIRLRCVDHEHYSIADGWAVTRVTWMCPWVLGGSVIVWWPATNRKCSFRLWSNTQICLCIPTYTMSLGLHGRNQGWLYRGIHFHIQLKAFSIRSHTFTGQFHRNVGLKVQHVYGKITEWNEV